MTDPIPASADVVVVGAGIGGLVAAALLARRGRRVLVVDRHVVAGGNATVFRRGPWEFDVGLHYVGGGAPGEFWPRLLEAAGAAPVTFEPLDPDGYDVFDFPGFRFRVPVGIERFRERLAGAFPGERRGIDRWARLLGQLRGALRTWHDLPSLGLSLLRAPLLARHSGATLGGFLDTCTRDPLLRAVLAGQNLGYALPPSRASLLVGAGIAVHYLDGAWYPRGGGQVLADRLAGAITAHGGLVALRTTAVRIDARTGSVRGVELQAANGTKSYVSAPVVVANADLRQVMGELVDAGVPRGAFARVSRLAREGEMAPALGVLYLGLKPAAAPTPAAPSTPGPGRVAGHPGPPDARANLWIHPEVDVEPAYAEAAAGRFQPAPPAFVTIASLKDPSNARLAPPGHLNVQLMTVAPSQPAAWGVTAQQQRDGSYRREPAYLEAKQRFAGLLLDTAARAWPDVRGRVAWCEVASPLTHSRYTRSTGGTSYGLAATPRQMLAGRAPLRSGLPGLLLCGASGRSGHGLWGAAMSGLLAAGALVPGRLAREVLGTGRG